MGHNLGHFGPDRKKKILGAKNEAPSSFGPEALASSASPQDRAWLCRQHEMYLRSNDLGYKRKLSHTDQVSLVRHKRLHGRIPANVGSNRGINYGTIHKSDF